MVKRLGKSFLYSSKGGRLIERAERTIPFLRQWHRFAYQHHFLKVSQWERLFNGVYPDFQSALDQIGKDRLIGYDNPETTSFLGRGGRLLPSDYPILFRLAKLFPRCSRVFDFGGYIGISYNTYQSCDIFPQDLDWLIYDVPAVVAAGKRLLEETPDAHLRFTTDFHEAASADILLAAGSLQFSERSLAEMLAELERTPEHILINKTPMTEGKTFFTLHNMGPAIAPYKVSNGEEFIASITDLGYTLIDRWKNPDFSLYIPFHPEKTVSMFDGFYFQKLAG